MLASTNSTAWKNREQKAIGSQCYATYCCQRFLCLPDNFLAASLLNWPIKLCEQPRAEMLNCQIHHSLWLTGVSSLNLWKCETCCKLLQFNLSFQMDSIRSYQKTSTFKNFPGQQYTLFQNGHHYSVLLFSFKTSRVASFLNLKFKIIFSLERVNKG